MVFIEPLSGTTIEHKYLSRITFDFCWASFWINNRWCEWHNTSVCMDDVVSCMVWSEHDRYPRLVLYSPAVWFFDCTGIAAGFWIANTSASLLCFERSIYMSFIWQTLYEKGSVRVCWMSDWMHDWITWWGVYRPRVVWNMTDMSTLWLSGVPPLIGRRRVTFFVMWSCDRVVYRTWVVRSHGSVWSLLSGGLVLRLLPDCCGIGWIVIIVLCVCRSGRVLVGFVVLLCRCCFVIGLSVDLM